MLRLFFISVFTLVFIWGYGYLLTAEDEHEKKVYKAQPDRNKNKKEAPNRPEQDVLKKDTLNIIDTLAPADTSLFNDSTESNYHLPPKPPFSKFYRFMYIHGKSPIGLRQEGREVINPCRSSSGRKFFLNSQLS